VLLFTIRRVFASIFVLFAASILTFALTSSVIDPLAPLRSRQPPPTPREMDNLRHLLGLDKPWWSRYFGWLGHAVRGDFGTDLGGNSVRTELGQHLSLTLRLIVLAMILAVLLAVAVGMLAAVRQNKISDYVSTTISYILIALPVFWLATLLKEFVGIRANNLLFGGRNVIAVYGSETPGIKLYGTPSQIFWDQVGHLVLPTISLAALSYAAWSRFQRASLLDVLSSDYIRLARAKGLTYPRVLVRHALRNALIPLTTVVALGVGGLLGGALITEKVFGWNAMGQWFLDALDHGDLNILLCWLLVAASFIILLNLIADLLYAVLDPRIRLS
jgi:peptide/nickel transport system permease protein